MGDPSAATSPVVEGGVISVVMPSPVALIRCHPGRGDANCPGVAKAKCEGEVSNAMRLSVEISSAAIRGGVRRSRCLFGKGTPETNSTGNGRETGAGEDGRVVTRSRPSITAGSPIGLRVRGRSGPRGGLP